jgi:hypothetical protein
VIFQRVDFGDGATEHPPSFERCEFEESMVGGLAAAGFLFRNCMLISMSFAGLRPSRVECEGARFRRCDLEGFAA